MNMSFVFFKTDPVVSKEIFDYALKAICPQVGIIHRSFVHFLMHENLLIFFLLVYVSRLI